MVERKTMDGRLFANFERLSEGERKRYEAIVRQCIQFYEDAQRDEDAPKKYIQPKYLLELRELLAKMGLIVYDLGHEKDAILAQAPDSEFFPAKQVREDKTLLELPAVVNIDTLSAEQLRERIILLAKYAWKMMLLRAEDPNRKFDSLSMGCNEILKMCKKLSGKLKGKGDIGLQEILTLYKKDMGIEDGNLEKGLIQLRQFIMDNATEMPQ